MQVNGVDLGFALPAADGTTNLTTAAVIGNKSDATVQTVGTTASLMAYEKGLMNALIGAGATTFPSAAVPANSVTLAAVLREMYNQMERAITTTTAQVLTSGTATAFTVSGGPIEILNLGALCVTTNNTNAAQLQWAFDGTNGSSTTITGASTTLASLVAGDMVIADLTLLSTTPIIITTGTSAMLGPTVTERKVYTNGPGILTIITSAASSTGTWNQFMRYRPLTSGVTVTAAF